MIWQKQVLPGKNASDRAADYLTEMQRQKAALNLSHILSKPLSVKTKTGKNLFFDEEARNCLKRVCLKNRIHPGLKEPVKLEETWKMFAKGNQDGSFLPLPDSEAVFIQLSRLVLPGQIAFN